MSSIDVIKQVRENSVHLKSYNYGESDTTSHLIDPVLSYCGYPVTKQRRESQVKSNRPDIVIWENSKQMIEGSPATAIIEVKSLGTDFNGNGMAKQNRPKEQIVRYVTGYQSAGPNTLGMLTDGNKWHLVLPVKYRRGIKLCGEFCLLDGTLQEAARKLEEINKFLKNVANASSYDKRISKPTAARALTNAIADGANPAELLRHLVNIIKISSSLPVHINLQGKAAHAERSYWDALAYTTTEIVDVDYIIPNKEALCVAVLRMKKADSESDKLIYREDVATAASTFAKIVPLKMSVVLVVQPDESNNIVNSRIAVHCQGHTAMTTEFDPCAPSPMVLGAIQRICDKLATESISISEISDAVAAKEVREEFYEAVANGWTLRQYKIASGSAEEVRQYKRAVLRHLIRTLFVWILKEEGELPQEVFDEEFAKTHAPGSYHDQILTYMFHERLNKSEVQRARHKKKEINDALQNTRFLNGSLFAWHESDTLIHLRDEEYFGDGEDLKDAGLFTILSEYDWSASEHTPTHSDQTIDPEVLSKLFENLIAVTEKEKTPNRMPDGTYYTPADVVKEMTKDALMMATRMYAPQVWNESELLRLYGDSDFDTSKIQVEERKQLARRIKELMVFDPAVGSGEFLLSVAYAIRNALGNLGVQDASGQLSREIISNQLHGQDINAMSVQITRLRLFIAIIAAEKNHSSQYTQLPNLESKIVCADTLGTVPDRNWSPSTTGELQDHNKRIVNALIDRASIFAEWQNAHDESAKTNLRKKDKRVRAELKKAVTVGFSSPETIKFAEHPLLEPDAPPVKTDPRLFFYQKNWQGFDIVIGNPPYEMLGAGDTFKERKRFCSELTNKGYTTVPANDLYPLITEAGLTLTKSEGGILTFIVPLSICFGKNKRCLRELLERNTSEIRLRSQDNRPEPIFHNSPVAYSENRQRTTILIAVTTTKQANPLGPPPQSWSLERINGQKVKGIFSLNPERIIYNPNTYNM